METVNFRKYSKVMDNVKKHLSKLEAKPEHAIKKGDPELTALVIQLYDEANEKIFIATLDKGLLKALNHSAKESNTKSWKAYEATFVHRVHREPRKKTGV